MQIIHKQQFDINEYVIITVPEGSKILDIQVQGGQPTIWYMFNESNFLTYEEIELMVAATGYSFYEEGFTYFKTIQMGDMVWHIFKKDV